MLLTIGITTYNRASYINRTLDYLLSETQKLRAEGEVEIIVIDNGSSDSTSDILESYCDNTYFNIKKNNTTLPVYESVYNVLKSSHGEFFWCFGDDDLVPVGYIADLLEVLKGNTKGLIVTGRQDFYDEREIDLACKAIELKEVHAGELINDFNTYDRLFGFLTSIVYQRKIILDIFESDRRLLANNYINKYVCWCSALSQGITLIRGPIAYKRCSIGAGSHFQSSLDIRVKTFIFDQAELAGLLEEKDSRVGASAYKKNLGSYREFLKYKNDGADLNKIKLKLLRFNVPLCYLKSLDSARMTPIWVIKCMNVMLKAKRLFKGLVS